MTGDEQSAREEAKAVARAFGSSLGVESRAVARLPFGNVNSVFKVEAMGRTYALKVFRHAGWPERGKPPWVESRLMLHGVPHAKMIYYTRDDRHFPHGFSVCEFVEGENCKAAIRAGRLTPAAYAELAGALLRRVHEISVPRYGFVGSGAGTDDDFVGWLLGCEVLDSLREIDDGSLAEDLYPRIKRKVEPVLRRFESRFRPALIHVDCKPKNGILDGEGRLVLVDWDEAVAGFWARDYSALTFWHSYIYRDGCERARSDEVREAFFRGYGETGFDRRELREIESALHTAEAAGVLSYLHRVGDSKGFERTRELLDQMLDAT